eukprot:CAMPEP_0196654058 /NCGR_PEP_ID=MMETSP1086-20130531/3733_1 /TAXON_ID=77921 /ORGANISM="Cyanoptyche  gloeocystis , Strain SAG4.97" /LENGTH=358 /DNA_ID=CAMNT_0041985593 /DNA_START=84 /DNA_END=1162 /DNA_ORIENTATION=+
MGAVHGALKQPEIDALMEATHFSQKEIKRLVKRFNALDTNKDGDITVQEFLSVPELASNPLVLRMISIFDTDHSNTVNFKEFIEAFSIFRVEGDKEAKLKFAFKIYDVDEDGYISNGELFTVLKLMVGDNLNDVQLQQIVDKTVIEADKDRDGKLSFEEFKGIIANSDVDTKMQSDFPDLGRALSSCSAQMFFTVSGQGMRPSSADVRDSGGFMAVSLSPSSGFSKRRINPLRVLAGAPHLASYPQGKFWSQVGGSGDTSSGRNDTDAIFDEETSCTSVTTCRLDAGHLLEGGHVFNNGSLHSLLGSSASSSPNNAPTHIQNGQGPRGTNSAVITELGVRPSFSENVVSESTLLSERR